VEISDDVFEEAILPMQLGIASWSMPWSIDVPEYPQPRRPLDAFGLLEKAVETNVAVVQVLRLFFSLRHSCTEFATPLPSDSSRQCKSFLQTTLSEC
jgi:hypothetical protein